MWVLSEQLFSFLPDLTLVRLILHLHPYICWPKDHLLSQFVIQEFALKKISNVKSIPLGCKLWMIMDSKQVWRRAVDDDDGGLALWWASEKGFSIFWSADDQLTTMKFISFENLESIKRTKSRAAPQRRRRWRRRRWRSRWLRCSMKFKPKWCPLINPILDKRVENSFSFFG